MKGTISPPVPDPLVAAGVDLHGLGFMLDVDRLLASELVALGSSEECWAALLLWCRAWKQNPAASLPNDDRILASFSGTGKRWSKVKAMALRGFVLCADGRLYHPVLAAEANKAWKYRQAHLAKRDKDAERLRQWRASQGQRPSGAETPFTVHPETGEVTPIETRFDAERRDETRRDVSKEERKEYPSQGEKISQEVVETTGGQGSRNVRAAA